MTTRIPYATTSNSVQATIYNIVSTDTTVKSLSINILDAIPRKLSRERGFPYIIIDAPNRANKPISLDYTKVEETLSVPITIVSYQKSVCRQVADAVISSLNSNQVTTRAAGLHHFRVNNGVVTSQMLDDAQYVYFYEFTINYTLTH